MKQPHWLCLFLGLAAVSACSSKSVELAPDSDASGSSSGAPSTTCTDAMCPELVLGDEPVIELQDPMPTGLAHAV